MFLSFATDDFSDDADTFHGARTTGDCQDDSFAERSRFHRLSLSASGIDHFRHVRICRTTFCFDRIERAGFNYGHYFAEDRTRFQRAAMRERLAALRATACTATEAELLAFIAAAANFARTEASAAARTFAHLFKTFNQERDVWARLLLLGFGRRKGHISRAAGDEDVLAFCNIAGAARARTGRHYLIFQRAASYATNLDGFGDLYRNLFPRGFFGKFAALNDSRF